MPVRKSGLEIPEIIWDEDVLDADRKATSTDVPFSQKVYDVAYAAINHGVGVAFGSTELPDHVNDQITNAQDIIETSAPLRYDASGSAAKVLTRSQVGAAYMRSHRAFAAEQADIVSDVFGRRARRVGSVLNMLAPDGIGETHVDDFFTLVYANSDSRIHILDESGASIMSGDISKSGIAAFCGTVMPWRVGFAVEPRLHRVDNPSIENHRRSIGITFATSNKIVAYGRLLAAEIRS